MKIAKKDIGIYIFSLITIVIIIFQILNFDMNYDLRYKDYSYSIYYYMENVGIYLYFYILLALISSNYYTFDFFEKRKTKFQNSIVTRIGFKKNFLSNIKRIAISSFLFRIICSFFAVILIWVFASPFSFSLDQKFFDFGKYFLFSNSPFISLIIYIIISSIGFALFSLFIYAISYYIKNSYLFRSTGVLIAILGQMILAFIFYMFGLGGDTTITYYIANIPFVGNMFCPLVCAIGSPPEETNTYLSIIMCYLFFGILIYYLLRYAYRKEKNYG